MGLLDDAIREHLDLKRRRGADPAEVEQAEREALGPVRRNRETSMPADPDEEAVDHGTAYDDAGARPEGGVIDPDEAPAPPATAYDQAADSPSRGTAYDQAAEEDWSYEDEREAPDEEPPPAVAPEQREDPGGRSRETEPGAASDSDDEPFAPESPPPPPTAADGETTEYDVENAFAGEEAEEDDVLEETPEFLQDTPDHDRLWFEQRPPRDFDFDG